MEAPIKKAYKRFRYDDQTLQKALEVIRKSEMNISQASRKYLIPKSTLSNKLKGKVPEVRRMGPPTILTTEEEERLEKWILSKAVLGFPMHPDEVKDSVQRVLKIVKRPNVFKDDRPGKKWLTLFLQRHPNVTQRNTEIISKGRASVTEEGIRTWFREMENYLISENAADILLCPERIFNADETGLQTCPKSGKLLGPKNYKNFYEIASGPEKECITVLCTFSAAGACVPPMVVYPYKRIPRDIASSMPESWGIGRSDSGWMVSATFYEFVANIFYPWLEENRIQLPVLFLLDGHKSHISMDLFNFCTEKKIILYCLLPNATHILQPCDVAVFKALKVAWKEVVLKHKQDSQKAITKTNFAPLFKYAFDRSTKAETIIAGFRVTGLFPFDPSAVNYSKCISNRRKEMQKTQVDETNVNNGLNSTDYKSALKVLENHMDTHLLEQFTHLKNTGGASTSTMFHIWSLCKEFSGEDQIPTEENNSDFEIPDYPNDNPNFDINSMPIEIDGIVYNNDKENIFDLSAENIASNSTESAHASSASSEKIIVHSVVTLNYNAQKHEGEDQLLIPGAPLINKTKSNLDNDGVTKSDELSDSFLTTDNDLFNDGTESNLEKNGVPKSNAELFMADAIDLINNLEINLNNNSRTKTEELQKFENDLKDLGKNNEQKDISKGCCSVTESELPKKLVVVDKKTPVSTDPQKVKDIKEVWSQHLHWPSETPKTTKRKCNDNSRMPYAITSKKFKEYMDKKEAVKREKEELKVQRKLKVNFKIKKTNSKTKTKKKINKDSVESLVKETSENAKRDSLDTDTKDMDDGEEKKLSTSGQSEPIIGSYVIVLYDKVAFPGIIKNIDGDEYEVQTMCKVDEPNHFKWPSRVDKIWYNKTSVLDVITEPRLIRRGVFECNEVTKYMDLE